MAAAPTKVDGGGCDESEKACENRQTNVDIVRNVQSSGIQLTQL
jgi:hypothetical protein